MPNATAPKAPWVAAYDRASGKCQAVFRPHDMDNAIMLVAERKQRDAELPGVFQQSVNLTGRNRVSDRTILV